MFLLYFQSNQCIHAGTSFKNILKVKKTLNSIVYYNINNVLLYLAFKELILKNSHSSYFTFFNFSNVMAPQLTLANITLEK